MFILKDDEFEMLRNFLYERTGISLNNNKKALMFNRLHSRIKALNYNSFEEYYTHLKTGRSGLELEKFIDAITTNETYFFRDNQQFTFFSQKIIPELIKKKIEKKTRLLYGAVPVLQEKNRIP